MESSKEMKYYNAGGILGVIGTYPCHTSGDYTFLVNNTNQWIKTKDLYNTHKDAEKAPIAKFSVDE